MCECVVLFDMFVCEICMFVVEYECDVVCVDLCVCLCGGCVWCELWWFVFVCMCG